MTGVVSERGRLAQGLPLTSTAAPGAAAPTGTGFAHVTSGVADAAAVAVDLSTAHATGTLAAARFPALTGDVTTVAGALAATLANTAVTPASYGNSTNVATFTVDAKGRLTAAANVAISAAVASVTAADTTLTISPTTGAVVAGLNLGNANTWTAAQTWRAGTTAAGTAPFYMQSGPLLTAPAVGAFEFLTDKYYATITTGTARKELTLNDAALTSGRVVVATTNGRVKDFSTYVYDGVNVEISSAANASISNIVDAANGTGAYGEFQVQIANTRTGFFTSTGASWSASGIYLASQTNFGGIASNGVNVVAEGGHVRLVAGGPALTNERLRANTTAGVTVHAPTAIPAGGTAATGLMFSSTANFGVFFGSGAPTLSAAKGSLYLRSDGSTTNDRAYINTNGTTGWTALITAA